MFMRDYGEEFFIDSYLNKKSIFVLNI